MSLKLMYITNKPEIARIAENAGVDRVFVDLEYIGKKERQGGLDTVQSKHTVQDVAKVRKALKKSQLLVRVNPIHEATEEYCSSEEEINGADIVMLPYFKTKREVETFINLVGDRAKTMLLIETPEAVNCIDEILNIEGIDEVFIGLNDLSLGYGKKFMFEPLADGTVDMLCEKFKKKGLPYGFGGIASLGRGTLPSEFIIKEHYRLGSSSVILSRSFCNLNQVFDTDAINSIFINGVRAIRDYEKAIEKGEKSFAENKLLIKKKIREIVGS